MIYDHISQAEKYFSMHPHFKKAFNYLTKNDFIKLSSGKHKIEQDQVFALINKYFTKSVDESFSESHKKYIDIQFLVSGKEKMGFGHINNFTHEQYNPETDLQKHAGKLNFVDVEKNYFTIFFPEDVHMPGLQVENSEEIVKVVIKIAIE